MRLGPAARATRFTRTPARGLDRLGAAARAAAPAAQRKPMVEVSAKQAEPPPRPRAGSASRRKRLHGPALLAQGGREQHVAHARQRAQPVGGDADLLAGHVIDLEAQHRDLVLGRAPPRPVVERERAQHVGLSPAARAFPPRFRWRAGAPRTRSGAAARWRRMAAPVGVTRSPPIAVVAPGEAFEQARRRRRRHRQQAVLRAREPAAARQVRDVPARAGQRRGDAAGGDHVHQRIPVADLVEMHALDRHLVDERLRLGEQAQDRDRMTGGAGRQWRGFDPRHHVAEPGMRVRAVVVVVAWREAEAEAAQPAAHAGFQRRRPGTFRQHRLRVREHARAQVGARIEHGGHEHVARHSAHRVELHGNVHLRRSRVCLETRDERVSRSAPALSPTRPPSESTLPWVAGWGRGPAPT